jgi:hypothetical protein
MAGPLKEHAVGSLLAFCLEAPQNFGMTTRQQSQECLYMLVVGGGDMRSDARSGAFSQMKGFAWRRKHPWQNRGVAGAQGQEALQRREHHGSDFDAWEWPEVLTAIGDQLTSEH